MKAPGIGLESAHGMRALLRVICIPGIVPQLSLPLAKAITLGASGSASIFPLSLSGEAVLISLLHLVEFLYALLGVIPGYIFYRAILTAFMEK